MGDVRRNVSIVCSAVYGGQLHLSAVSIGAGCKLEPGTTVSPGTRLAPQSIIPPMTTTAGHLGGTAEAVALSHTRPELSLTPSKQRWDEQELAQFMWWQDYLRICLGIPWLCMLFAIPFVVVCICLDYAWVIAETYLPTPISWPIFCYLVVPVFCTHCGNFILIAVVILHKRLVVGRFGPGKLIGRTRTDSGKSEIWHHWGALRRWAHEQIVTSHAFESALIR